MSDVSQSSTTPHVPEFWLPAAAAVPQASASVRRRILIGKPGLDGHDRGAKYVAQILRDAGHEVIYTGIRRTPEQIVAAAVQEDVDAIGLSLLSGSHNVLFARVLELLRERHADDIVVFGGGVIPADDVDRLLSLGVKAVFTPGTSAAEIVGRVDQLLSVRATT
jgi:methylmalonyl-CoA mutase C-terminal domain/subunit